MGVLSLLCPTADELSEGSRQQTSLHRRYMETGDLEFGGCVRMLKWRPNLRDP